MAAPVAAQQAFPARTVTLLIPFPPGTGNDVVGRVLGARLSDQFGHAYAELRQFRRFFLDSLARVRAVYPQANVSLTDGGVTLLPSRPHLPRRPKSR